MSEDSCINNVTNILTHPHCKFSFKHYLAQNGSERKHNFVIFGQKEITVVFISAWTRHGENIL